MPCKNIRQVTHIPCTGPHILTHAHITRCLPKTGLSQTSHAHTTPPTHSPAYGTGALDVHGLGLSIGADTSARLMPSPHKARQGKAISKMAAADIWKIHSHRRNSVAILHTHTKFGSEIKTDVPDRPGNRKTFKFYCLENHGLCGSNKLLYKR